MMLPLRMWKTATIQIRPALNFEWAWSSFLYAHDIMTAHSIKTQSMTRVTKHPPTLCMIVQD